MKTKSIKTAFILEAKALFGSMRAYLYIAAIILSSLIYTVYFNIYIGYAELTYTLRYLALPIMLASPLITARSFAGERERDRMLISFGESNLSLLFGRLLATCLTGLTPLLPLFLVPISLGSLGEVNLLSDYLGILSIALFCLAYVSALTLLSVCCGSKKLCYTLSYAFFIIMYLGDIIASVLPLNALALTTVALILSAAFCAGLYRFTKNITVTLTVFSALTVFFCAICNFASVPAYRIIKAMLGFFVPNASLGVLLHGGIYDVISALYLIIFAALCAILAYICLEKRETE